MARWVKVCALADAPQPGHAMEGDAEGVGICLANVRGVLSALDNWCPHRRGPLGQGWVEAESVVCPWHSWTFNVKTGVAEFPVHERVAVFAVRLEDGNVLVEIGETNQAGNTV